MSLIQKPWFRALSYVGIFFLSWVLDVGLFMALYEKVFYPGFSTMLYVDFSASVYALLFSLYFLKKKHFFSLIVPTLNFFIGLVLLAFEAIVLIGACST
ncbi:hypothetical protein [Sulfuracidifex metallicus]|uniref:Uncharacterized protein n=1 Tax=Sulfuracidifex metallicus DSM 6482 = JCM 9184 TaxID=523847 RepID=A0A6A9QRG9_SULME|nr:hypothetical protein [Sulfuracidifex metallicus]MUN29781.1 hypothetical protein [Sulfuracidifex metallicus DSM 6482 = JCM 9184]WOE51837.1 hypothetical protein RQ359_001172 [Sulfuracidifex metallicus DSM 6482 = JCM 9184]